ncbi:MAG: hypothetical protein NZ483_05560 [Verrucomicrobiae bacterium]|nr:hypothetical protein [Verrucomicrobiae bacterium]MDW8343989.1 hypothetical protein [Verrucomicrobiae bacterium]
MGKKKKKVREPSTPPAAAKRASAATEPTRGNTGSGLADRWREVVEYPTLALGIVFGALTLLSAFMCVRFHDKPEMGGIREPTALILWAGITVTLLASYYRERRRPPDATSAT